MPRVEKGQTKESKFWITELKKCIFFEKNVFCSPSTYLLTPRIELYINPFQFDSINIHCKGWQGWEKGQTKESKFSITK